MKIKTVLLAMATIAFTAGQAFAHCGACGSDGDHKHEGTKKEYTEGSCCSKEHFIKKQKEAATEKAKAEFKPGSCCSAEHYAEKKAKAEADAEAETKE